MNLTLTGILQDGSPLKAGISADPRTTLNFPRGTDVRITVRVLTPSGSEVDLSGSGTTLILTIKKKPEHDWPKVVKEATIASGVGTFLIEPGDTANMAVGRYVWDVWLTKDGDRNAVIPLSAINLQPSVAYVPEVPPPPIIELVENDTEPMYLDFSGTDITGWLVEVHINYSPTPLVKSALLIDPTHGIAQVNWSPGDLRVGVWGGEVQTTRPGDFIQTSDVFQARIRAEIA